MKPIRTYKVSVRGFTPALYSARSPGKARARSWREYASSFDASFADFLKISSIERVENPPGIGDRILVGGEMATRVIGFGQYIHFMRDDSDDVLCSHPADVTEAIP